MILNETYTLNNGIEIPKIAFGTWLMDDETAAQSVKDALDLGYRHIDTAQAYGNEVGVGHGLRASGLNREDIFVTSKIAAELKDYDGALASIDKSINDLAVVYIDLMIIHAPQPWAEFRKANYDQGNLAAWKALETALKEEKVRAIGVSNFEKDDLQNILDNGTVKPAVNQILVHIGNIPAELIQFSRDQDILVEAYSPIGHGEIFKIDAIKEMADKYKVSIPQLAIRYTRQLGTLPLPKSTNKAHIESNAQVDFEISAEDMDILRNMEKITDYGDSKVFPVFDQD
ncbi:aldo/keto reductase [Aerococcus viridans]